MTRRTVRIAMNGVTGRMGYRQHLVRSILAIRELGGLDLGDGEVLWPEPVLVGRRAHALEELAARHGLTEWSTDLDAVLADDTIDIYFDAQVTSARVEAIKKAIAAGKHIYTEKPTATDVEGALDLARLARDAGIKHGVVQDKIFLPGLLKLKRLIDGGFFGEILSIRGSSVTGSSKATGRRPNAPRGTTARRTAAASSSTCSRTGSTCSTSCSARSPP